MPSFGAYPTPVQRLTRWSTCESELWVKRDDLTSPVYGGNKVRKLELVLAEAQRQGKRRVVTLGAMGSHHVLATGIFAKSCGLEVEAVVVGQPRSAHVLENLRASVGQGVRVIPASNFAEAALMLGARVARGAYFIPAGGSSKLGTLGYVRAAGELAEQVARGEMPEPDLIVVALGSGGTAAGLSAGVVRAGLRARVLGVTVAEPARLLEHNARALTEQCAGPGLKREAVARLELTRAYLGRGYGYATPEGERARDEAAAAGLVLDATYTAKAFAAACERARLGRERTILFWHTLSSALMTELLSGAPGLAELDPALLRLAKDDLPRDRATEPR